MTPRLQRGGNLPDFRRGVGQQCIDQRRLAHARLSDEYAALTRKQRRELATSRDLVKEFLATFPSSPLWPEASLLAGYVELARARLPPEPHPDLVDALASRGITAPFPIQELTIPDALAGLDCTAVVAVGDGNLEAYPAAPHNLRLVGEIAQPLMLECADLFVNHGGFNGIRESLRAGVPMTVLPWMTDSVANAERAESAGVATVVPYRSVDADSVRAACRIVLDDPAYRARAQRVRRDMLALPPIESYVADLASLAARVPA
jgi:hypothetical protein